jgi:adenosylcobinamide-phosphate synthase
LKCSFAVRALLRAASDIADALRHHDLPQARHLLGYHLVSRQVDRLRDTEISAATIESVAENTSDSFVAPIFYFLIAGLPGAFVYRYVNTCDAMLGYRTEELEWLGKAAARVDDLLNWIPARLSALLLWLASSISLGRPSEGKEKCCSSGWRIWWRDAGLTESPNAGHPMSMAAGVLGVALEKRNHYRLGSEFPDPTVVEIDKIQSLFRRTVLLVVLLTFTICCVCSTY